MNLGVTIQGNSTCTRVTIASLILRTEVKMLRNSLNHSMRKIRKRKLIHLFINIPSTIPQIFQSSQRVNIQLGNKAGFLRTEITPLTSEITKHTQHDRKHAFCKRRPRLRTAVEL